MRDTEDGVSRRTVLKRGALATGTLVVGGVAATGTAAAGIGEGRVGHYHLNNLRGSGRRKDRVHDASPQNNHGTNRGAEVVRGGGSVGNAFGFDGEDDYVVVDHDESLSASTLTVATWLKFTGSAAYHFFLSKRGDAGDEYQMYYRGADAGRPETLAYWDGDRIYDAGLSLEAGVWHHLAWVVDGDGLRGYHDGEEVVTKPAAATPSEGGTSPLYIGADSVGNYASGLADEVRIYDRALSTAEVEQLASMGGD